MQKRSRNKYAEGITYAESVKGQVCRLGHVGIWCGSEVITQGHKTNPLSSVAGSTITIANGLEMAMDFLFYSSRFYLRTATTRVIMGWLAPCGG